MQDLYSSRRSQRGGGGGGLPTSSSSSAAALAAIGWSSRRSLSSSPPPSSFLHVNANTFFNTTTTHFDLAPTKVLNDRIRARDWDSARIRVLSHPWDSAFRAKQLNNATPLHLACLYRAPADLVRMVLEANPEALFCQDSEGWTPLHVCLLYGSNDPEGEETALMLIQRGGYRAASVQSRIVGSPLHLACRHGCSTSILRELLRVNPSMATTPNEYSRKPATILWHQFSRNPENESLLNDLSSLLLVKRQQLGVCATNTNNTNNKNYSGTGSSLLSESRHESMKDLVDRLTLLVRAAKGNKPPPPPPPQPHQNNNNIHCTKNCHPPPPGAPVIIHDVIASATTDDLTQFLPIIVLVYPDQVKYRDEMGNLPLHNAAAYPCGNNSTNRKTTLRRTVSMPSLANINNISNSDHHHPAGNIFSNTAAAAYYNYYSINQDNSDPLAVLLQSYPVAASLPNSQGLLPLHIALVHGKRTWRTGIASLVLAAPQALMKRDPICNLLPFQLAAASAAVCRNNNLSTTTATGAAANGIAAMTAMGDDCNDLEAIETIMELVLACPHAMISSIKTTATARTTEGARQ